MKLLVNAVDGGQEILEVGEGGGYFDASRVLWDERLDGPMPSITLGGMVRIGGTLSVDSALLTTNTALTKTKAVDAQWEAIKTKRDGLKSGGVLVNGNWFQSDTDSRIQFIGLVIQGANIAPGTNWKTMDKNPDGSPVFVTMTRDLANAIFQAIADLDKAAFAKAEEHRIAMTASVTPASYDFSAGWPAVHSL